MCVISISVAQVLEERRSLDGATDKGDSHPEEEKKLGDDQEDAEGGVARKIPELGGIARRKSRDAAASEASTEALSVVSSFVHVYCFCYSLLVLESMYFYLVC